MTKAEAAVQGRKALELLHSNTIFVLRWKSETIEALAAEAG
ncbi:hypothetical protein [Fictibacillus enclensis]|nr:hypothetical protein [Fictibacillus enclensis]